MQIENYYLTLSFEELSITFYSSVLIKPLPERMSRYVSTFLTYNAHRLILPLRNLVGTSKVSSSQVLPGIPDFGLKAGAIAPGHSTFAFFPFLWLWYG